MTDEVSPPITQQFMQDVAAAVSRIDSPPPVGVGVAIVLANDIASAAAKAIRALEERLAAVESGRG
jgi:hypothetical protein